MTKAERVLFLARGLAGPRVRDGAGACGAAWRRRADAPPRRRVAARARDPVEGERGRGGSYRLRPGYRVPPLMFTASEAAAVALGLMAAQRLGLETDGALAKVRRALHDRVPAAPSSRSSTRSGSPGSVDAAPPDGETLLALADAARRGRRVTSSLRRFRAVPTSVRELSPHGVVAHFGSLVRARVRPFARGAAGAARGPGGFGAGRRPGRAESSCFDAVAFVSVMLARVPWAHEVEVVLHTDFESAVRPVPADTRGAGCRTTACLLRLRAESLDWAAGLLAGAGCSFEVLQPEALRAHLAVSWPPD